MFVHSQERGERRGGGRRKWHHRLGWQTETLHSQHQVTHRWSLMKLFTSYHQSRETLIRFSGRNLLLSGFMRPNTNTMNITFLCFFFKQGLLHKTKEELQLSIKLWELPSIPAADLSPENKGVLSVIFFIPFVFFRVKHLEEKQQNILFIYMNMSIQLGNNIWHNILLHK